MADLFPDIPLDEQIAEVEREIRLRERVYPRWVAAGNMKQGAADRHIAAILAVKKTLEALK